MVMKMCVHVADISSQSHIDIFTFNDLIRNKLILLYLKTRRCKHYTLYPNEAILQRHLECNISDIRQVLGNNCLLGSYSPVQCLTW